MEQLIFVYNSLRRKPTLKDFRSIATTLASSGRVGPLSFIIASLQELSQYDFPFCRSIEVTLFRLKIVKFHSTVYVVLLLTIHIHLTQKQ